MSVRSIFKAMPLNKVVIGNFEDHGAENKQLFQNHVIAQLLEFRNFVLEYVYKLMDTISPRDNRRALRVEYWDMQL